jgi:hypothetical protein
MIPRFRHQSPKPTAATPLTTTTPLVDPIPIPLPVVLPQPAPRAPPPPTQANRTGWRKVAYNAAANHSGCNKCGQKK